MLKVDASPANPAFEPKDGQERKQKEDFAKRMGEIKKKIAEKRKT